MERFLQMLGVLVALYVFYNLTMGRWHYVSPAQREKRRKELKEAGLSSRFYFMHPLTQFVLTIISGGLFTFYWLYRQWGQIKRGFKRENAPVSSINVLGRTLGGCWSFFILTDLINRTCEYLQKPVSWPAWWWGILWLGGLVCLFCPVQNGWKICGYLLWCIAPVVLQRRINTLTREHISMFPRTVEIIATLLGVGIAVGIIAIWR